MKSDDDYDTYRIMGSEKWNRYYDSTSGWICVGNPVCTSSMQAVQSRSDCGFVFDNGLLQSVWVKAILS